MSSQAGDAAGELLEQWQSKLSQVAPSAVGIQLALMLAISLVTIVAFSFLRPNNSMVYQPKIKYSEDGKAPPKLEKGFFDWVKPLIQAKEPMLLDIIGLDAVIYLRFLRMCRTIFIALAVVTCAVLIPVDVAYNLMNVPSSQRNPLSMLTIEDIGGDWIWAHVAVSYVITLIVLFFIWRNYAHVVMLRWKWFRSDEYQNSLHARSLVITQVVKGYQSDGGLSNLLNSLSIPYPTTAVHIGRRVHGLPELIEQHNEAVEQLEHVLTSYFEKGAKSRPTIRVGANGKKRSCAAGGERVDAIDYLTGRIKRLEDRVEQARQTLGDRKPENYGFASFESVPYAHMVARTLDGKRKHKAHFELAPQPHDILWKNITLTDSERGWNKFVGGIILVVTLILYLGPLVAVSLLANLTALSNYVPFIDTWSTQSPFSFSAFAGIVPPALALLLQLLLPVVIRWIATFQGATTHSQLDRIVTGRYAAFLFITQFFIFSLLGVFFNVINEIVIEIGRNSSFDEIMNNLSEVPDKLQNTWVVQSTYWLTVFPLRGFSAIFDLAQAISLLYVWVRAKLFGRTPREIRNWTKPPNFDYPVYFANSLLMVAVGFVYAPLAPLVPTFAACQFAISAFVYKYQLMYVSVSRVETGGRLWNVVINRMLICLVAMQALMTLTIGLKRGWLTCTSMAPPILAVLVFKIVLRRRFDNQFRWYIPPPEEAAASLVHRADARKHRLERRFGHPSLNEPLYTPMLRQKDMEQLPSVYHGRIAQKHGSLDGKEVDQAKAGGLTFAMLRERDLEYDRTQYLRERDDDQLSISTAAKLAPSRKGSTMPGDATPGGTSVAGDDYFAMRKEHYLRHGATASMGSLAPTAVGMNAAANDSSYELAELKQIPTHHSGASQERLLAYPSPRYGGPGTPGSLMTPGAGFAPGGAAMAPTQSDMSGRTAGSHGMMMTPGGPGPLSFAPDGRITPPAANALGGAGYFAPTQQRPLPPGAGGTATSSPTLVQRGNFTPSPPAGRTSPSPNAPFSSGRASPSAGVSLGMSSGRGAPAYMAAAAGRHPGSRSSSIDLSAAGGITGAPVLTQSPRTSIGSASALDLYGAYGDSSRAGSPADARQRQGTSDMRHRQPQQQQQQRSQDDREQLAATFRGEHDDNNNPQWRYPPPGNQQPPWG